MTENPTAFPIPNRPSGGSTRPLHILMVTGCYAPDRTGTAPMNTQLCEHLARRGYRVSVVTGLPHYPDWKVPEAYRRKWWSEESSNGVNIYRGPIYVPARPTPLRRILYDTSIGLSAGLQGLPVRGVDLVLAVSPPLQAGLAGHLLARIKGAPFLLYITDVVPDLAIALGMLRNRSAIRLARALENYVYRHANAILAIAEGFVTNLKAKNVPESKIFWTPLWVDTRTIRPDAPAEGFREAHRFRQTDFLVLYSGNLGAKQKLENVISAAAHLADRPQVRFCFTGDGVEKARLEAFAKECGIANVRFLPLQPWSAFPGMLAASDVLVLNQSAKVADTVIPSKLLTYMAAGRPVVAAVSEPSEAARCVHSADCGLVVEPENPGAFAEAVRTLDSDRAQAARLGENGRKFVEKHFACEHVFRQYEKVLLTCAAKARKRLTRSRLEAIGPTAEP